MPPRGVLAPNASPLTLDGTRTWLVGSRRVAVIDPGPAQREHLDAVVDEVGDGVVAAVLLTHTHPDHAAGAARLAERVGSPLLCAADGTLAPGQVTRTDAGDLVAVPTPGHTPDHVAFHWPREEAVFCGDLLLGGESSALVAPPEGDLGDYLDSLERLRALRPRIVYPTHGGPIQDPDGVIAGYVSHRSERLRRLLAALEGGPADEDALLDAVYAERLSPQLRVWASRALPAYLLHLEAEGRIERAGPQVWRSGTAQSRKT